MPPTKHSAATTDDQQEILQLFEAGDRALIAADVAELQRIYAEDYVQYDETGSPSTRQDLIQRLSSGALHFLSMRSTGRRVRLFGDFAIVHGAEEDELLQSGVRKSVRYVYMDIVARRDERWQIVGSQLVKVS